MAETEKETAENETASTALAEGQEGQQEQEEYQYNIKVEDAGPATKKVYVEIPQDRIQQKLAEQYKELRSQAAVPGFRVGHAPQKLIEKRFATDVKEQVRRSLVSESYEQAMEKNKLQPIGEPEIDNADKLELPENGSLSYTFQVEIQPQITVPDLKGLKVKKPKIDVKEENVDQAMANLREQQGILVPVEDRGVQDKDYMIADVHIKVDGNVVAHAHDAQLVARPGRVGGIQIDDLVKHVEGMKLGETRTIHVHGGDTHPNPAVRNKDAQIELTLKDLKRLELATIDQDFLDSLGFTDEKELRGALREQMVERINYDVQQAMHEQVKKHLLDSVQMELPTRLSARQEERVVGRRAMELMSRGISREQIEANLERLRSGARDEAVRELKLFFILQQIANERQVDVDEGELNGRIAMLAAQRGRRPEKMKQDMAKDGSLTNLYIQMREQKALDKVLEDAQIEEVEMKPEEAKAAGEAGAAASGGGGGESSST
jgi:trigger factor